MSEKVKLILDKRIKELGEKGILLSLQNKVLDFWQNNNEMRSLLEKTKEIIRYPETSQIYSFHSGGSEVFRMYHQIDFDFLLDYIYHLFILDEEIYVLYKSDSSEIDKNGISLQGYPIFKIEKTNVQDWLQVLNFSNYKVLVFLSIDGEKFIDISHLDDEKDTPHYNVMLKNNAIYQVNLK